MSVRRFDLDAGGDAFSFKPETETKIAFWLSKYPEGRKRSAVIPLLWLAQKDNKGWLSEPAMRVVADRLEMAYIRVYEIATFYTMFRLRPVGAYHLQVCGTTPCMLRGAEILKKVCSNKIGDVGEVSADGTFSWEEVECLGACVNAPVVQVNDDYFEDLDKASFKQLIEDLTAGKSVAPGPQIERINSAPVEGPTCLLDESLYDGSKAVPLPEIPNAPEPEEETFTPEVETTQKSEAAAPVKVALFGKTESFDKSIDAEAVSEPEKAKASLEDEARPANLEAPHNGEKDPLQRISGVGPKIEGVLNGLGIYHFSQIAGWTRANIEWVDSYLSFKGRIDREQWKSQAKVLDAGGDTEFSAAQKAEEKGGEG